MSLTRALRSCLLPCGLLALGMMASGCGSEGTEEGTKAAPDRSKASAASLTRRATALGSCVGRCSGYSGLCSCQRTCLTRGHCCADDNQVCACKPQCTAKQCGGDGCGGTCGQCGANEQCDANSQCVPTRGACAGIPAKGCCKGEVLHWCHDGQHESLDCEASSIPYCGWSEFSVYDCWTPGDPEPTGTHAMACAF